MKRKGNLYKEICNKNDGRFFDRIFFISSTIVYVMYPNRVTDITPLTSKGIIYDFHIEGSNYIEEKKYQICEFK